MLFAARFDGPRWVIAMSGETWLRFRQLPPAPYVRLTAMLELLVKAGESNLPGRSFRWNSGGSDGVNTRAEIEAHGVVLSGHVASADGRQQFFITEIAMDEIEEGTVVPQSRPSPRDARQGVLQLDFKTDSPSSGKNENG